MANYFASGYANTKYVQVGITMDWPNRNIIIPRTEMTLIQTSPVEVRELDANTFRLALKSFEDEPEAMVFPNTHNNYPPTTVGGVTLARVIELINDYTVTFEDGQYAVNIVGANTNIADRVIVNQVSVRSANSAGLIQTRELEQASYNGKVYIDTANGTDGTVYPTGTLQKPVKTLVDAKFIAAQRGLDLFYLKSNITIGATDDVTNLRFEGDGATLNVFRTTVTLMQGCITTNSQWTHCKITGYQGGESQYHDCIIDGLENAHCIYKQCGLLDGTSRGYTIKQTSSVSSGHASYFKECYSDEATAIIDRNGARLNITLDGFNGRIKIINQNHPTTSGQMWIHMNGGTVTVDSTCTTGKITVTGFGTLVNNSLGTEVDADGFAVTVDAIWSATSRTLTDTSVSASTLLEYKASNITTDSDPGAGRVRWNNATQASATQIYLDHSTNTGLDISAHVGTIVAGTKIMIQDKDDSGTMQKWVVGSTVNNVGYVTINVALTESTGGNISNNQVVAINFRTLLESSSLTSTEIADAVWYAQLVDYTTQGTFGEELATHSDIHAATATSTIPYVSGSIIYGTLTSGTIADTTIRDNNHWVIDEDNVTGLTVEFVFNLASAAQRAGVFTLFGRYDGKGTSHYIELWVWNVESAAWELLHEDFMISTTLDTEFSHSYYEQHVDRSNNNEVKIRLVHNVTTYHNSHDLHIDSCAITAIDIITAADIADAVWDKSSADHNTALTMGAKLNGAGNAGDPWTADLSTYGPGTAGATILDIQTTVDQIETLSSTQETMILEMYELLGLDPTKPLTVTKTARTAGTISQTIVSDANSTVVTRV